MLNPLIELLHTELQEKQCELGLQDNDFINLYEIVEELRESINPVESIN